MRHTFLALVLLCLTAAPLQATTQTDVCAQVGRAAANAVALRDRGIPPSRQMALGEHMFTKNGHAPNDPAREFYRWMILFVYDMAAMDAPWIRQRVETQCFHTLR